MSVTRRKRLAYHEAGHAVLSAALNDMPSLASVPKDAASNGRVRYGRDVGADCLVQICLAGYASEELLTGARPIAMKRDVAFAVAAVAEPSVRGLAANGDAALAVAELLELGVEPDPVKIRAGIDAYYALALESLRAARSGVDAVARALLAHSELDRSGLIDALAGIDFYGPVFDAQNAHPHLRIQPP